MNGLAYLTIGLGLILTGCSDKEDEETTEAPDVYQKIYGASDVYVQGDYVYIKSNGLPDHKSVYYEGTQWASTKYQAYNGTNTNFHQNPNVIGDMSYTFKIPLSPSVDANHESTPLGPIGVALNGVPFFNQYAAGNAALTDEINSFDTYYGHPTGGSQYHYHIEPTYLTETIGNDELLGFLLDGFPAYGSMENGTELTSDDLDAYHGHTDATTDYPDGIYHYHITSDDPYINGAGFYGSAGTLTQ